MDMGLQSEGEKRDDEGGKPSFWRELACLLHGSTGTKYKGRRKTLLIS